jgi:hypothetical protein
MGLGAVPWPGAAQGPHGEGGDGGQGTMKAERQPVADGDRIASDLLAVFFSGSGGGMRLYAFFLALPVPEGLHYACHKIIVSVHAHLAKRRKIS